MPIYHKKLNGRKVWWVRVVYRGLNASRVCATREAAKDAESELREALRRNVGQAEQTGLAPATVKQLFEAYVADLEARGKGPETIGRAAQTATTVEAVCPELLSKPVGAIRDADIFYSIKVSRRFPRSSTTARETPEDRRMTRTHPLEWKWSRSWAALVDGARLVRQELAGG